MAHPVISHVPRLPCPNPRPGQRKAEQLQFAETTGLRASARAPTVPRAGAQQNPLGLDPGVRLPRRAPSSPAA